MKTLPMKYIGSELELFAHAHHWKSYYQRFIKPHLKGRVLEVGAGIGATTEILCDGSQTEWLCLEPDVELNRQIADAIHRKALPTCCRNRTGTIQDLERDDKFNTILYIDVLEHIAEDREELCCAASHLGPAGKLIILSPAHPCLYSPFDKSIGHFRRYTRRSLAKIAPAGLTCKRLIYLDSVGLLASGVNRLFLQQSMPQLRQILFWDRVLIPASRLLDPCLGYALGKSVYALWEHR